ncbi:TATA element modulatory factor-like isoform X2 [Lytechinus variegatus]|uniref:TATA element modulatory factor-like isoform X2 n=1 Tax=Lytechinus variegatus TaxID=7654 RepID=UPI001BB1238C|nr:TATA element modulatory factor-like isoform X2 [Lytechinus variegatus]
MSWFNQASLSSFAKTALSTAQKSIDKVLDIQDEDGGDTGTGTQPARSSGGSDRQTSLSTSGIASGSASLSGSGPVESGTGEGYSSPVPEQQVTSGSEITRSKASKITPEDDTFFNSFLSGNEPTSKPKKTLGKKLQTPVKVEDAAKESHGEKPTRLISMSAKSLKTKSKIPSQDSDDSDERDTERRVGKSVKKSHLGSRKADSREAKSEAVLQPLHVDVGLPEPVLPQSTAPPTEGVPETPKEDSKANQDSSIPESEDCAINPEIVKSTESFLLVKSSDARELEEENDNMMDKPLGQSLESSNSTSTGTVEAGEDEVEKSIPSRCKSSDLDTKSESENTDEQTSVRSDSDFVVINEHTASEQSSVYLYDTRESPENTSPKHYSSSSNGKRSPTDSDFSIISEGRFNDMQDPIHAGAQSQDVGNIVEQASMALIHRVSPSYSADVESEDQDDKLTPSSSTDERPRSSSEEGNIIKEERTSTPTPKDSQSHESSPQSLQEEDTPRSVNEDTLKASPDSEEGFDQNSATQPQKLLKKLAEMAQVLEAREAQIIHLSQQNGELQESATDYKNQAALAEEKLKNETYDLQNLTDEFTQRISSMEKKLQLANRERDQFKKDSQKMQKALNDIEKNDITSKVLSEKDEQISELMIEGEKLSKQQLQNSNIIKKLRAKEKETDKLLKTQKEQLDQAETRVSHLEEVLDAKEDVEKKQKDAIKTLNTAVEKQEKEILNLKSELEEGREKVRSTQHALDASYKEIAELHRSIAAKESKVQETALSVEMNAKEELKLALDRSQLEARRQHEGLLLQVNDLQLSLNRADQQNARKEDAFRQEISDLQQRLQEAEARNQELSQSVTAATRPLLRQIENLQATFNAQSSSWEQVERSLTERLSEAQTQLAVSAEKERGAQEAALEASSKVAALESQLAMLRQEKSRLTALLEMEKARVESLEESKTRDFSHMENQLQNYLRSLEEAQQEKSNLEKQLQLEHIKVETERKKLSLAQEALEEKERRLQQSEENSGSPSPSSRASTPVHSDFRPSFITNISRTPSQNEILERTMSMSMTGSVYDSVVSGSATSIIESLQSQLKQREGEISQLQSEIFQLERTRSSMAEEIVKLTNQTDRLEEEVSYVPELRIQLKDLQHRYNAVLQMYGEKAEEVQELKLDLQDVKEMYRQQIEDLIRGST